MAYNPFALLRQNLPGQLFSGARSQAGLGKSFLSSRGIFDPNLEAAVESDAFGKAIQALSSGMGELTAREGEFTEGQRRFDITTQLQNRQLDLQEREFNSRNEFGPFDIVAGIGGLLSGVGSLSQAYNMFQRNNIMRDRLDFGGGGGGGPIPFSRQWPQMGDNWWDE